MLLGTSTPLAEPAVPAISAMSIYPTPSTTSHSYPALIPATRDHDFPSLQRSIRKSCANSGTQVLGRASPSRPGRVPNLGWEPLPEQGKFPYAIILQGPKCRQTETSFSDSFNWQDGNSYKIKPSYREDPLHLKPTWQHPQLNQTRTRVREGGLH